MFIKSLWSNQRPIRDGIHQCNLNVNLHQPLCWVMLDKSFYSNSWVWLWIHWDELAWHYKPQNGLIDVVFHSKWIWKGECDRVFGKTSLMLVLTKKFVCHYDELMQRPMRKKCSSQLILLGISAKLIMQINYVFLWLMTSMNRDYEQAVLLWQRDKYEIIIHLMVGFGHCSGLKTSSFVSA